MCALAPPLPGWICARTRNCGDVCGAGEAPVSKTASVGVGLEAARLQLRLQGPFTKGPAESPAHNSPQGSPRSDLGLSGRDSASGACLVEKEVKKEKESPPVLGFLRRMEPLLGSGGVSVLWAELQLGWAQSRPCPLSLLPSPRRQPDLVQEQLQLSWGPSCTCSGGAVVLG